MAEEDDSQRTEEPTRKRLDDAEQRGQVANSRELTSFLMLLSFTLLLYWVAPSLFRSTHYLVSPLIERPDGYFTDEGSLGQLLTQLIIGCGKILLVPFAAFLAAVFGSSLLQNRFIISFDPITPDLNKLNPLEGMKRLFSTRSLTELAKSAIKMVVISFASYLAVAPYVIYLKQLPETGLVGLISYLTLTATRMLIGICIVMFFLAIIDYLYQRFEYLKSLRMTKQEVKDEFKQQEGDPQVKRRLRTVRIERARKRMMAAVPTSDVVITNPTHYSIALKYDSQTMQAPRIVAKGADNIALRIREIAEENNIPLYENPPLAQALYATVDIDQEIPTEHYKAVAEVISYVYRLKGKFAHARR